ncbi:MAG: type I-D CRISPR-associated protein Cas7/Csc2 [candidate division WOR-3 bacterium]|nr:type I-D CRISPR-associated protein Cas7/Csc2 [candidate division WOR-3 bacterium]
MSKDTTLFSDIQILSRGVYLQVGFEVKLLDDAVIRSNEPEEILSYSYEELGNRFIIPWRKFKGKLRRLVMEQQRRFGIAQKCCLKNNLCLKCPSCLLFGGTGETSTAKLPYNLLSRVLGETLISKDELKDVKTYTANAVDEIDLTTGQALMTILTVPAETEFIGIVTLRDPTPELTAILVDNLKRVARIGASTREWGRCEVSVKGYRLSNREDISVYEIIKIGWEEGSFKKFEELKLPSDIEKCYKDVNEEFNRVLENTLS